MHPRISGPVDRQQGGGSSRLRIGLLLDSLHQPAWVHRTVSDVLSSGIADIEVVVTSAENPPTALTRIARLRRDRKQLVFELYRRFDRFWFEDDRPDPFAETDLAPLLAGIHHVILPSRGAQELDGDPDRFPRQLAGYGLDVALRFGAAPLDHAAICTRFGVWAHVGDSQGDPHDGSVGQGYREVLTGSPVTRSALQIDPTRETPKRVIYESFASTATLSAWKNRRELYWKTSAFVARKLRELAEFGPSVLDPTGGDPAPLDRPAAAPRNVEMLGYLPRLAARYVSTQVATGTSFDQWFIAYRFGAADGEPDIPDTRLRDFTRLVPPRDRMWADPFPILHEGRYFVFLEELLFSRNKGHLSVMAFDHGGTPTRPELVLETENHLSYPFLLKWKGEIFMVPESARAGDNPAVAGSRSVPVFRARRFPSEWVQETVMLDGLEVFDPTVLEIDGTWWLFCTQAEPGASTWDELHLFHGATPFGPWKPHRRNPVKSDVRSARPAGRPYHRGGAWYRPAQNCSVRYGYGLSINRIERLTPNDYCETEVMSILPDWAPGLIGTHTLNAAGLLTVTDGRLRRSKWSPDSPGLPPRSSTR